MHVACVVTPSRLAYARVLAESFRRHHPDGRVTMLLAGVAPRGARLDGAEVVAPADAGVDVAELHRRALLHGEEGLPIALGPALLVRLLDDGAEAVLLLDTRMLVLRPLDDVWTAVREAGVLLARRDAIAPEPGTGERAEAGEESTVFDAGFLGVGASGRDFVEWLGRTAAHDGDGSAQRGLDAVPELFPHRVLDDPGVNARVPAMHALDVTWAPDGPFVDGTPLRLFHFKGFDPARPDRLCRHDGPDGDTGRRFGLRRLCRQYATQLAAAGWSPSAADPWSRLPCGLEVDDGIRAVFREGLGAAESGRAAPPPDPFDTRRPHAMREWLESSRGRGLR